jgi:hypothetical protein
MSEEKRGTRNDIQIKGLSPSGNIAILVLVGCMGREEEGRREPNPDASMCIYMTELCL